MIPRELRILLKDRCPKTLKDACIMSDALDRAREHMFSKIRIAGPQSERSFETQRQSRPFVPVHRYTNFNSNRQSRPFSSGNADVRFQVPSYRSASSHTPYERGGFRERNYSQDRYNGYQSKAPFQQSSASAQKYCNFHKSNIGPVVIMNVG